MMGITDLIYWSGWIVALILIIYGERKCDITIGSFLFKRVAIAGFSWLYVIFLCVNEMSKWKIWQKKLF